MGTILREHVRVRLSRQSCIQAEGSRLQPRGQRLRVLAGIIRSFGSTLRRTHGRRLTAGRDLHHCHNLLGLRRILSTSIRTPGSEEDYMLFCPGFAAGPLYCVPSEVRRGFPVGLRAAVSRQRRGMGLPAELR